MEQLLKEEFVVTARKWRPQSFEGVVGQSHISTTLRNAIEMNRIAHAYLFTGSRGVGKTSTARIFARALNCMQGPTPTPCGVCEMCREIIQGSSMDVIEIDGASNNKVDEVRELRDSVKFVPSKGKYKIYIIDEVHMLTNQAFNALLKTLEEPPPHVIFIFATTEPQKLLPTILSRCQRFDFHRIPQKVIQDHLAKIAEAEQFVLEPGVLEAIARAGDSSMRDAQSMFDQVISFCGSYVTLEQVSGILGIYSTDLFFTLTTHAYEQNIAAGIEVINQIIRDGKNLNHFFDGLLEHFRYLLLVKLLAGNTTTIERSAEEIKRLADQAAWYTPSELEYAVELIAETGVKMRYALSKQVSLELLFLKLSRLQSIISIDQALLRLEELQQRGIEVRQVAAPAVAPQIAAKPEPSTPLAIEPSQQQQEAVANEPIIKPQSEEPAPSMQTVVSAPMSATPQIQHNNLNTTDTPDNSVASVQSIPVESHRTAITLNVDTIRTKWETICEACHSNGMLYSYLVNNTRVLDCDGSMLKLGASDPLCLDVLRDRTKDIESLIESFFKQTVRVKIALDTTKPERDNPTHGSQNVLENENGSSFMRREDEILNDPKIQMLIEEFDGKVKSVRRIQ